MNSPEAKAVRDPASEIPAEPDEVNNALYEANERLRWHIEHSPLAVIEFDPEYRITAWSPRAERLFGWKAEEVLGRKIGDFRWVHEEDVQKVERLSAAMFAGEERCNIHHNRNYRSDGSVIDCEWHNSTLTDPAGRLVSVLSLVLDVTERKRAEEAARASDRRFRRLAEVSPFGVSFRDFDGAISYANDAFLRIVGYQRDDLERGLLRWDTLTPTGENHLEEAVVNDLRTRGISPGVEKECIRKDGSRVPVLLAYALLDEPYAEQQTIVVKIADLTPLKQTEQELRRANAALRRRKEEWEQFSYAASHDLREPIRQIATYSQLLAKRYGESLNDEAHTYLGYCVDGARRMGELIRDLLAFVEAGERGANDEDTADSGECLQVALANLRTRIEESGARIEAGQLPRVGLCRSHLTQILQNLIQNALKYRHPERPSTVLVSAVPDGARWLFEVADNGIGIAAEHHQRVFRMFQRLTGPAEGTGIGLAICRKIVERHGGRIWVESQAGEGATFRFTLPKA